MRKFLSLLLLLALVSTAGAVTHPEGKQDSMYVGDVIGEIWNKLAGGWMATPWDSWDSTLTIAAFDYAAHAVSIEYVDAAPDWDTIITTAGDSQYFDLPTNLIEINGVVVRNKTTGHVDGLSPINFEQLGHNVSYTGSDIPQFYVTDGRNKIWFDPINNAGDTLIIFYGAYSNFCDSATGMSNVRLKYKDLIVAKAAIDLLSSKHNAGRFQGAIENQKIVVEKMLIREEQKHASMKRGRIESIIK